MPGFAVAVSRFSNRFRLVTKRHFFPVVCSCHRIVSESKLVPCPEVSSAGAGLRLPDKKGEAFGKKAFGRATIFSFRSVMRSWHVLLNLH